MLISHFVDKQTEEKQTWAAGPTNSDNKMQCTYYSTGLSDSKTHLPFCYFYIFNVTNFVHKTLCQLIIVLMTGKTYGLLLYDNPSQNIFA